MAEADMSEWERETQESQSEGATPRWQVEETLREGELM